MLNEGDSRAGHPDWMDIDVYTGEPREMTPLTPRRLEASTKDRRRYAVPRGKENATPCTVLVGSEGVRCLTCDGDSCIHASAAREYDQREGV